MGHAKNALKLSYCRVVVIVETIRYIIYVLNTFVTHYFKA